MILLKTLVAFIIITVGIQYILYFCENVVDGCDEEYKRSFKDIKKAYLKAVALKTLNPNIVEITIETGYLKWQRLQIDLHKMHPGSEVFYERGETLYYCPASFIGSVLFNLYFKKRIKSTAKQDSDKLLNEYLDKYENKSQE